MSNSNRWFRGTCSNCRKKKQRVHKCGGCQVCKTCAAKLKVIANQIKVWG